GGRCRMERARCGEQKLSTLDGELEAAFKQAQERSGAKMTLTRWQREWLSSPDVTDCKTAACLLSLFAERVKLLNSVAPATDAAARRLGEDDPPCKDKQDMAMAVLSLGGAARNGV